MYRSIGLLRFGVSLGLLMALSSIAIKAQTMEIVTYYFVELIPNAGSPEYTNEQLVEIQRSHLDNIKSMAREGKLLLAGPFEGGGGIFILNADSPEQAQEWVERDPAVKAERFTFKIRRWFTERGMLSLESSD